MPMSLISAKMAGQFLLIQFAAVLISGLLFLFKGPGWATSAIIGGFAALLPNIVFMMFFWRFKASVPSKGNVAWIFALGEATKMMANFIILLVAIMVFKATVLPLVVTWVLVLVLQIVAPALVNNKG